VKRGKRSKAEKANPGGAGRCETSVLRDYVQEIGESGESKGEERMTGRRESWATLEGDKERFLIFAEVPNQNEGNAPRVICKRKKRDRVRGTMGGGVNFDE